MNAARLSKIGISVAPVVVGALGIAFDATDSWGRHSLAVFCFVPAISYWVWSVWSDYRASARHSADMMRVEQQRDDAIRDLQDRYRGEIEAVLEARLAYLLRTYLGGESILESYPPDYVAWRLDCGYRLRNEPDDRYWLTIRGADSGHLPGPNHRYIDRDSGVPFLIEEVLKGTGSEKRNQIDVRFFIRIWPADRQPTFSNVTLCATMSFPNDVEWNDRIIVENGISQCLNSDELVGALTHLASSKLVQGEWRANLETIAVQVPALTR